MANVFPHFNINPLFFFNFNSHSYTYTYTNKKVFVYMVVSRIYTSVTRMSCSRGNFAANRCNFGDEAFNEISLGITSKYFSNHAFYFADKLLNR